MTTYPGGNGYPPAKPKLSFLEWLTHGKLATILVVVAFTVIVVFTTLYGGAR